MAWWIGIDEAGYGPNLGPMVQAAVTVQVPQAEPSLWERLRTMIRRSKERDDGRLLIDDSKQVHDGVHGFRKLEHGVLAIAATSMGIIPATLHEFLEGRLLGNSYTDLCEEDWFVSTQSLPLLAPTDAIHSWANRLRTDLQDVLWGPVFGVVVPTPRFNALLDKHQVKSVIVGQGVVACCEAARRLPGDDPLYFAVDKLGGRNYYAPLLQEAFPDGWVHTLKEGPEHCEYRILGLERDVYLHFLPRADSAHLPVAAASMVAKYLRELAMKQFNSWWLERVPGIAPTAGYPVDANRFMAAIRPTMQALGIPESRVWRVK